MKELLILAVLVESLVQIVKSLFDNGKLNRTVLVSIAVGLLLAFTIDLDIFSILGLEARIAFVGVIATGLLISRGANFVHDLIDKLHNIGKE